MSTGLKVFLGIIVVAILASFGACGKIYITVKTARGHEIYIKNAVKADELSHSKMTTTLMEVSQVPKMMKDDLKEVVRATMEGRYGDDGSNAMFQWIKEQNPSVDSSLYTKIQQLVEANRTDFMVSQKTRLDKIQQYESMLADPFDEMILSFLGYPRIDLEEYKNLATTQKSKDVIETGVDEVIDLR